MCSYIIKYLFEKPGLKCCYYYCNSHDTGNTSLGILKTIVIQLLRGNLDFASLIANSYVYQGISCGMAQLRVLVPQLLELSDYTRIIVDGLDECPPDSQRPILKELQSICLGPRMQCKILVSSRRDVPIYEKLSQKPQILLDGRQEVEMDIKLYVKYKVSNLRTSDENLLARVESILVEKANGRAILCCFILLLPATVF
jgi:hypothetical protein